MKKIIALVTIFAVILTGTLIVAFNNKGSSEEAYLRVHIRANSNQEADQSVKYKVKAAVVDFLTPKLTGGKTFKEAYDIINSSLREIEKVADSVLVANGFSYTSKARLNEEYFPTRSYENVTLENGYYDALILELGEGVGNNWWCVVYPPLCFIGSEGNDVNNIKYKSKLVEIVQSFFEK